MDIPVDFPLKDHIDQTILKPSATIDEIVNVAVRAGNCGFAACCVPPYAVREIAGVLKNTNTAVQTVIGFPLGFHMTRTKVFEAESAVNDGAGEIDMVVNRGWIRSGEYNRLESEVRAVVNAVFPVRVKTILEISDLNMMEILTAAEAAVGAGAEYVKTSTGFFGTGADINVVEALKEKLGSGAKIKASGGIRDLAAAWDFIVAGASRIGTSSGESILSEFKSLVIN